MITMSRHRETFTEEQLTLCFDYLDKSTPDVDLIKTEFPNGIIVGGQQISIARFRAMCLHLLKNRR